MFSLSGTSLSLAIECVRVCGFPRTWSHVVTNEVFVMHTRKRSGCDSVVDQPRRCNIWEDKTEIPSSHTWVRLITTGLAHKGMMFAFGALVRLCGQQSRQNL